MSTRPVGKKKKTSKVVPIDAFVVPEVLTVEEAAAAIKVSKMTIYRIIDSGDLPHFRIGRSVRIRRDDFEHYLKAAYTD